MTADDSREDGVRQGRMSPNGLSYYCGRNFVDVDSSDAVFGSWPGP